MPETSFSCQNAPQPGPKSIANSIIRCFIIDAFLTTTLRTAIGRSAHSETDRVLFRQRWPAWSVGGQCRQLIKAILGPRYSIARSSPGVTGFAQSRLPEACSRCARMSRRRGSGRGAGPPKRWQDHVGRTNNGTVYVAARLEALAEPGGICVSPGRAGRGRGTATDVPRNPDVDRPTAGAAGTSMTGRRGQDATADDGRGTPS
jgi:hypothetical protein